MKLSKYLEIDGIHPDIIDSSIQTKVSNLVEASGSELEELLLSHARSGKTNQIDVRLLIPVFEKLDTIIAASVEELPHDSGYTNTLLIATLKYLSYVLKNSVHKRYFLSTELVGKLLYSMNHEVVGLATEILFYFSMPSLSIASYNAETGWKDTTEVSANIANNVLIMFEALGFMSHSYGLIDFLRGQEPLLCPTDELILEYPIDPDASIPSNDLDNGSIRVRVCLASTLSDDELCRSMFEEYPSLTPSQQLSVRYVVSAAQSLRGSTISRVGLLALRMRALYVLVHSHLSIDTLAPYLAQGGNVLKDLIVLSDVSSSVLTELQLAECPYPLSTLALDCIVGLLETSLHRRKLILRNSDILQDLGVIRSDQAGSVSQELPWFSVLLTACSVMASTPRPEPCAIQFPNAGHRSPSSFLAEYVQMAIELFSACLSIKDHRIVSEGAAIGAVVGLVYSSLDSIGKVLRESNGEEEVATTMHSLFPVVKALQCLEVAVSAHSVRDSAFRESEGLSTLTQLFELLATHPNPLMFKPHTVLNDLLGSALSLLSVVITAGRRRVVLATESGLQILYQPHFAQLCQAMLRRQSDGSFSLVLVQALCELFTSAIDIEPQFLAHFLRGNTAHSLLDALVSENADICPLYYIDDSPGFRPGGILIEVARLVHAMCITSDGKSFVGSKKILTKLINSLVHPNYIIPRSEGIAADILSAIGHEIALIVRDHDNFRPAVLEAMRSCLMKACADARNSLCADTEDEVEKLRYAATQRIQTMSSLVESLNYSSRSSSCMDSLRQFFRAEVLDSIVATFHCTLPPPRQLFAQITSHHPSTGSLTYLGDFFVAKALSSLTKLASSVSPQLLLPVLFSAIDSTLGEISAAKEALYVLSKDPTGDAPPSFGSSIGKSRSKLKKQKAKPPNVVVLGVLDSVPDFHIFSKEYRENSIFSHHNIEACIGNFVKGVLTLEWLSVMTSHCFKPGRYHSQGADPQLILAGKDVLRRLFAFHRSSLLEVCRVSSKKWKSKGLSDCWTRLSGGFDLIPPDEDDECTVPQRYIVRIIISSGAIVREGSEIDGSRIVLLAPRGATTVAYERVCTPGGVIRYRTAHGWLSEFQRDFRRDPIVSLVDTINVDDSTPTQTVSQSKTARRNIRASTLRDGVCYAFTRVHAALKLVATHLSQSVVLDIDTRHGNCLHISDMASLVAGSLANITAKFFENPQPNNIACKWPIEGVHRTLSEEEPQNTSNDDAQLPSAKTPWGDSKEGCNEGYDSCDRVDIDEATAHLFFGALSKFIVQSIFDDKNGHPNTYLLKRFLAQGVIQYALCVFQFTASNLDRELLDKISNGPAEEGRASAIVLSPASRCALHSLSPLLVLVHIVVDYKRYKPTSTTNTLISTGTYDNDLNFEKALQKGILQVGQALLPILKANSFARFPSGLQIEWMRIVTDMVASLHSVSSSKSRNSMSDRNASTLESTSPMGRILNSRSSGPSRASHLFSPPDQVEAVGMDMGFSRADIRNALNATMSRDLDVVMEYLFTHPTTQESTVETLNRGGGDGVIMATTEVSAPSSDTLQEGGHEHNTQGGNIIPTSEEAASSETTNNTPDHGGNSRETGSHDEMTEFSREMDAMFVNTFPSDAELSTPDESSSVVPPLPLHQRPQWLRNISNESMGLEDDSLRRTPGRRWIAPREEIEDDVVTPYSDDRVGLMSIRRSQVSATGRPDPKASSTTEEISIQAASLMAEYGKSIIPFVEDAWKYVEITLGWSDVAVRMVFARMCEFLLNMHSSFPELDQTSILHSLTSRVRMGDTEQLHGVLMFLLSLLRSKLNRMHIEREITSSYVGELIHNIVHLISAVPSTAMSRQTENSCEIRYWPRWVVPALLICYDLVASTKNNNSSTNADSGNERGSISHQAESKEDAIGSMEPSTDSVSSSTLIDMGRNQLVQNDAFWELYEATESMLLNSGGDNLRMDNDTCHALLLVLCELLSKDEVADRLVKNNGLVKILSLPSNEESNAAAANMQPLLSMILRRCFETKPVLKLCMRSKIKSKFETLEEKDPGKPVLLVSLVEACADLIYRSPEVFLSAAESSLVFTRKSIADPITVKLSEGMNDDECKLGDDSEQFPGSRALMTLSVFISRFTSPNDTDKMMFSNGACLNALSDCILSVQGISLLVAKCRMNFVSLQSEFFIPYLIRTFLSKNCKANSAATEEVQGAARIMTVLSCNRGRPRKVVLDSIVETLKQLSLPKSPTNKYFHNEAQRLQFMARVGRLLSLVVTSCRAPKDSAGVMQDRQHVSVDAMLYLSKCGVPTLIVQALASVDIESSGCDSVFDAMLGPLEILTRPKFILHFHRLKRSLSMRSGEEKVGEEGETFNDSGSMDRESDMSQGRRENVMSFDAAYAVENHTTDQDGANSHPEDDDDDEEPDEEEDEDDDDEDDDDDDDDDEERYMRGFISRHEGHDLTTDELNAGLRNLFSPDIISPTHGLDLLRDTFPSDGNPFGEFITPPDQVRRGNTGGVSLQAGSGMHLMGDDTEDVEVEGDYGTTLLEFIRRTSPGQIPWRGRGRSRTAQAAGSDEARAAEQQECSLLPGGIDRALQANWRIGHPMLIGAAQDDARGGFVNANGGGVSIAARTDHRRIVLESEDTIEEFFENMLVPGVRSSDQRAAYDELVQSRPLLDMSLDSRGRGVEHVIFSSRGTGRRGAGRWDNDGDLATEGVGDVSSASRPVSVTVMGEIRSILGRHVQLETSPVMRGSTNEQGHDSESEQSSSAEPAASDSADAQHVINSAQQNVHPDQTTDECGVGTAHGADNNQDIVTSDTGIIDTDGTAEIITDHTHSAVDIAEDEGTGRVICPSTIAISMQVENENSDCAEDSATTLEQSGCERDQSTGVELGNVNVVDVHTSEAENLPVVDERNVDVEVRDEPETEYDGADPDEQILANQLVRIMQDTDNVDSIGATVEGSPADTNENDTGESAPATSGLVCPPGYDAEVFNSLPEFMQREIIETHEETSDQSNELLVEAGYDLETINALPDNIRQEILDQVRRERDNTASAEFSVPADPSHAEEMDNSSFLTSLTPDLRAEVLLTSDSAFIATLTPELIAEAQLLRERAAHRWNQVGMMGASDPVTRESSSGAREESKDEGGDGKETPAPGPSHPGQMRVEVDSVQDVMVPHDILAVLIRLMYLEKLPVPIRQLHRMLQNLSKQESIRDMMLQLIIALLSDSPRETSIFRQMREGPLRLGNSFPPEKLIISSRVGATLSTPDEQDLTAKPLPSTVGKRLISMLIHLCAANESIVYDILRSRAQGQCLMQILDDGEGDIETDYQKSQCYLELLIRLLHAPNYTNSTQELLQLTRLVNTLCEPLELLDEVPEGEENVEEETSGSYRWVNVPSVCLSRSTLRSLCDALLNELCTKEVFDHVISAISRLAHVKENRTILMEVVIEVLVDLGTVSHARMQHVLSHLVNQRAKQQNTVSSSDSGAGSSSVLNIPIGEVGSQDHTRVLRALQTLQSLAEKVDSKLVDVAPVDDLQHLWLATEQVLRHLETYVQETESSQGSVLSGPAGGQRRQQHSVLSSILSKLLPVIEGFFLVHAGDILQEKELDRCQSVVHDAQGTASSAEATALERTSSFTQGLQLSKQQSLPGAKYRDSSTFLRSNISLVLNDNTDDSGSKLSFRHTRSLRSTPSSDSVSGLGSHSMGRAQRLLSFVQAHKSILNILVRSYPSLLEDSLSAMIRISQLRSHLVFDNKRAYFYSQLKKRRLPRGGRTIHLQVRRDNVFEDSFHQLRFRTPDEMKGRLVVNFYEEEGIDAGGLTREWYMLLSREIFNPNYCLFTGAADGATFQPNPLSNINTNHLDYFKFVGRVIGKAVVDGYLLDGHFTRSFYKHVLGVPVEYSDIEGIEPEYFKSLKQILEYPLEDLGLELTFSSDVQTFGRHEVVDLIPNGRNIPVTDSNKADYIRLISHHSMTSAIRSQIDCFLQGFHDLVPAELISIFSPTELELLISGLPDIDIDDLKANTEYHQYRASEPCILWFWDVLRSFSREERALFLQFITGTSKVPLDGFANLQGMRGVQRFSIHRAYGDSANLPTAHTCFNQLDLPEYSSQEELREKLLLAIKEGSEGFGFA
eukprot:CAMPEP_0185036162 /NCGR_PEP_ID=MMETSP1103-20130426/28714_1 /TAXON_ID=36769 /ORGANISM="Paraphysomonas bandaiensis, Strain Caron Lab Isolate" /LENGTH=4103 /DNA_ID=CAMNT_0027573585 /DNA_START=26 /DNA_END=12337 /DNA_ORIENTATION=+